MASSGRARTSRVGRGRYGKRGLTAMLAVALVAVACASQPNARPVDANSPMSTDEQPQPAPAVNTDDDSPGGDPVPDEQPLADPAAVGANELGDIPVIMYHRIIEDGSEFDTTADDFRAELEHLYAQGYRPVRLVDVLDGHIDIPAGTSPVVLTFDDSSPSQFALDADGNVVPDTAMGVLLDFAAEQDDFAAAASFYVLEYSFGASGERAKELLRALNDLGVEIGNHTAGHENLRQAGSAGAERALAAGVAHIQAALGDVAVRTLSLPFGVFPDERAIAHRGSADDVDYQHDGILLVGAGPAPSPFHADFDPLAIPRIRSQPNFAPDDEPDFGSGYWLWQLEQTDGRRYVADGDPDTISFPRALEGDLNPAFAERANPY